MKYTKIVIYIGFLIFGIYLIGNPYFNIGKHELIKSSDGREILCDGQYRGVLCYDVTTEYLHDYIYGDKMPNSNSPIAIFDTIKYNLLQKLWLLFVVVGLVGLVREYRKRNFLLLK